MILYSESSVGMLNINLGSSILYALIYIRTMHAIAYNPATFEDFTTLHFHTLIVMPQTSNT